MKNLLNILLYNYNIEIENIIEVNNEISYFYMDYVKYYILKSKRAGKDLKIISEYLNNFINDYHTIIKNRFGEIITEDNKSSYVLIRIKEPENNEIELSDIINKQIIYTGNELVLDRSNWEMLWSEKVDYLEYQVSEMGKNHPTVIKSFSYYVGLAENAIEYFTTIKNKNIPKALCQKRIQYPNLAKNYYNPLNLVIDYRVRDIAEYLKAKFFEGMEIIDDIELITNKNYFNETEYNLLYSRLLYPSYYFDALTLVIEKNENDDLLLKYITESTRYEKTLNQIYNILSKKCNLIKISWLIKK